MLEKETATLHRPLPPSPNTQDVFNGDQGWLTSIDLEFKRLTVDFPSRGTNKLWRAQEAERRKQVHEHACCRRGGRRLCCWRHAVLVQHLIAL